MFYTRILVWSLVLRGEVFFFLGYLFLTFRLLNYLLLGGIYFFSFSLLRQYSFCILLCLIYLFSFHEFSLFSLIVGFPLSLVFYLKVNLIFFGCYYVFCLFLLPILISISIGNFPFCEEITISLTLLALFV